MSKKILIVAMNKYWVGISRMPEGLNRAGFTIFALCPKGSYLSSTKYLSKSILYPTFSYSRSKLIHLLAFYSLIKFDPDIVIPGDEEAIFVLQQLCQFLQRIPFFKKYSAVIRNSLPAPEYNQMIFSKSTFMENCERWGVSVPQTKEVKNLDEAKLAADVVGYPAVLKLDAGYGGSGVFVCQNEQELIKNFAGKKNLSLLTRIKFFIKNIFFISILDKDLKISIQQYVKGIAGHVSFCAIEGKMLAANPMLAIRTYPDVTGPSCVSQSFPNQLPFEFAKIVTAKISYNGFGSLDFMYDDENKKVYVIELNSRPTPPCHFSSDVVTHDLCRLFFNGTPATDATNFKIFTVAMFPNEFKRDPKSSFLTEAFHDIPYDDIKLLSALLT